MFLLQGVIPFLLAAASTLAVPTNVTNIAKRYEINCKGSGKCKGRVGEFCMDKTHNNLKEVIDNGHGDTVYGAGQHITCSLDCCAFFQHGAQGTVRDVFEQIGILIEHGCTGCGSIPFGSGELTLNYVKYPKDCGEGHLCPPKEGYACNWDRQTDPTFGYQKGQNCHRTYKPDPPGGCSIPTLCHFYGPDDPGDPYYTGDGTMDG